MDHPLWKHAIMGTQKRGHNNKGGTLIMGTKKFLLIVLSPLFCPHFCVPIIMACKPSLSPPRREILISDCDYYDFFRMQLYPELHPNPNSQDVTTYNYNWRLGLGLESEIHYTLEILYV